MSKSEGEGLLYRFLEWRGVPNMVLKVRAEFVFLVPKEKLLFFSFFLLSLVTRIPLREFEFLKLDFSMT